MQKYLDKASYVIPSYKYRMHYKMILSATGSGKFQHFYPANDNRKVYNFSKDYYEKVLSSEE